jgi:hypothetical protein
MYVATAFSACWRDCQATGQISSDFMVLQIERVNATGRSAPSTPGHQVVAAVPAPACRNLEAAFAEQGLTIHRAAVRPAAGMVNQSRNAVSSHMGAAQRFGHEVLLPHLALCTLPGKGLIIKRSIRGFPSSSIKPLPQG